MKLHVYGDLRGGTTQPDRQTCGSRRAVVEQTGEPSISVAAAEELRSFILDCMLGIRQLLLITTYLYKCNRLRRRKWVREGEGSRAENVLDRRRS